MIILNPALLHPDYELDSRCKKDTLYAVRILYLLVNCTDGTKKEELNKVAISNDELVIFVVFFL